MNSNKRFPGYASNTRPAARPSWAVPALAVTLIAGSTNALAQNSEFGLLDAIEETAAQAGSQVADGMPTEPVNFEELEGSVAVNEYDLVDLHVNSEDLGAVLQLLSIQSQRNIISSNSVQASVTADLYGVTFYEALDAILHVNGFGYIEKGNFIYVYTREELEEFERLSRKPISSIIDLDYLNSTDAAEFAKNLLSENGTITTSADSGVYAMTDGSPNGGESYANTATIVINDFEENVTEITNLISQLDTKPAQVLVEATILQTTLNEANAFGMDFSIISDLDFGDFLGSGGPLSVVDGLVNGLSKDAAGADVPAAGADGDGIGIGSNIGNVAGASTLKVGIVSDDISFFLRVLDQVTDVTVVSNPKLLTLNRQPARVLVGTRVGYLNTTTTETSTTQTVEFLDVGTQLSVRPFVSKSGLIRLELRPQVSNFTLRQITDNSGATLTIPDEDTTEMNTNVMLRDGQTAVLGGLFTESTTSTRRQVPVLGDIPLIGQAFRGNDDETRRTEIIFMITPSIVNDEIIADQGALGVDYIDAARVGARKSLLPFSRERQVGQLLIKARAHADAGENERALFLIDRALKLSPMSPDARMMKSELTNQSERMPSRAIINGMLRRELLNGESRLVNGGSGTFDPNAEVETEFEPAVEESFAEVPTESVSFNDQSEPVDFETTEVDTNWVTAEVKQTEDFESESNFENAEFSPAEFAQSEPVFVQITPDEMVPTETAVTNAWDSEFEPEFNESSNNATFSANTSEPIYTEVTEFTRVDGFDSSSEPQTDRFEAMKSVATAESNPEPVLSEDWYRWGEDKSATDTFETAQGNFGGFLVIPLPGGGALHIEWPITSWDWASDYSNGTFTNVDTDSFEPGVE
ncbi:MAG: type II secretion system protein GspD [Phycisphaerales bacterium]